MSEVTYTVGPDDLIAGNRLHFLKSFSARRWLASFAVSAIAVALIVAAFDEIFGPESYLLLLGSIWAIIVAICVFGWFMIPRQARRNWSQGQKMWAEQNVSWDAEKIHFRSDRGEVHVSWGDYHRWSADDRSLLLYQDARTFYLVPLRNFPPGAGEQMTQLLQKSGVQQR